jgi:hypothetical protein
VLSWMVADLKSIGKDRFAPKRDDDRFLGRDMTGEKGGTAMLSWMVGWYVPCTGWYHTSWHPSYADAA